MSLVERTASWRHDCLGRICGLANAQGGVLEVGRDDSGAVVEAKDVDRLAKEIRREVESQMGIVVDVQLKRKDGAQYVRIVVGASSRPVSLQGEFHYRSASTAEVLRGSALERFLARRRRRLPERPAQEADSPAQEIVNVARERPETTQETVNTTQETPKTTQEPTSATQETTPQSPPATTRERILALLKADPRTTRRRMAEQIGITPDGVKYHLAKLRKAGIIRHVGPTKAGRWEVLK